VTTVLIVEDNADLAYGLRNNLEIEGYDVAVAVDGLSGLDRTRVVKPDLVILDLMLPGLDGYRVLKTLREEGNSVPVLILTAHGEEADKVRGFRLGADDYVTKPFGLLELMARVAALLRRASRLPGVVQRERFGDIEIDARTRTVSRRGVPVPLTPMEYDLLLALLRGSSCCTRCGAIRRRS
jgi:DNA-binding response OmpR family regulator